MKTVRFFLLGVSYLYLGLVPSFSQSNSITAWGEIKYVFPSGMRLGVGVPTGIVISLIGSGYNKTIATSDPIRSALSTGRFTFPNVPYEKSMQFMIKFTTTLGGEEKKYTAAYKFHKPVLNPVQNILSRKAAEEMAGYIGTFTLDDQKGALLYKNKYK